MTEKEFDFNKSGWQNIYLSANVSDIEIKTTSFRKPTVDVRMDPYLFDARGLRILAAKLIGLAERMEKMERNQNV